MTFSAKSSIIMFKQKENISIRNNRDFRTRRHDAIVYETCKPNLEIYKKKAPSNAKGQGHV